MTHTLLCITCPTGCRLQVTCIGDKEDINNKNGESNKSSKSNKSSSNKSNKSNKSSKHDKNDKNDKSNKCEKNNKNNENHMFTVTGNRCRRGLDFAYAELTCPTRSLTTTVRTSFVDYPVLPVRTDGEIPKALIKRAMETLATVVLHAPMACGDTIVEDICGTGVRVIATTDLPHRA